MAVGLSDGTSYNDSADWFASAIDNRTDKQRSDQTEINQNSTADDFQSRFYATDQSTMPPQASTELAGALKSSGGMEIAARGYNTRLSPEMEDKYNSKFGPNDSHDYDMRGYFQANPNADPNATGVHYPDTFKKPNHPTFSDQSIYHGINGNSGGTWGKENGQDTFTPGTTNLENMHPDELKDYFKRVEPDAKLKDNPDILGTIRVPGNKNMNINMNDVDKGANVAMAAGPGTMVGVRSIGNLTGAAKGEALSNLGHAQVLEANGVHPDDIVKQTGFSRGAEGRWKTELDDSVSKFDSKWHQDVPVQEHRVSKDIFEQIPFNHDVGMKTAKLSEVLDHPELYKSIPALKDIKVIRDPGYPANGAAYEAGHGPGKLTDAQIRMGTEAAENHGTLMHEVQHAIQEYEGFAKGGAPRKDPNYLEYHPDVQGLKPEMEAVYKKLRDPDAKWTAEETERKNYLIKVALKYAEYTKAAHVQASDYYHRLAGEVESKNVDTRLLMTAEERKRVPSQWSEDTPRNRQIVIDEPAWTSAYGIVDKGRYIKH